MAVMLSGTSTGFINEKHDVFISLKPSVTHFSATDRDVTMKFAAIITTLIAVFAAMAFASKKAPDISRLEVQ